MVCRYSVKNRHIEQLYSSFMLCTCVQEAACLNLTRDADYPDFGYERSGSVPVGRFCDFNLKLRQIHSAFCKICYEISCSCYMIRNLITRSL
jgi:hypothetical protein